MHRSARSHAGVLLAICLGLAACGGSDPVAVTSDADAPSAGSADPVESGAATGSAKVVVGGEEYEFSEGGCTITGTVGVVSQFSDGEDLLNLTSTEDGVLVRMTLDGLAWVDNGSAPPPDVSGQTVTWSGEMSEADSGQSSETTTITMNC